MQMDCIICCGFAKVYFIHACKDCLVCSGQCFDDPITYDYSRSENGSQESIITWWYNYNPAEKSCAYHMGFL